MACCSALYAGGLNAVDDVHDLQGCWGLPVWVESSGSSRGTDGFNTNCMVDVVSSMPEHWWLPCPLDQLPQEDCSAASEVVYTN